MLATSAPHAMARHANPDSSPRANVLPGIENVPRLDFSDLPPHRAAGIPLQP